MDYARKFVTKKPASSMTTRSEISLNLNYPTISSNPQTEDKKLTNWKKWLADRNKHYKAYKKTLGRNQDELLLNSGEKYRSMTETRELMECAAEPLTAAYLTKNVDLGFWITPEVLPNRGNPYLPEVEVPSKKKPNLIPKLVHVAPPNKILEEKGLSKPSAFKTEYLEKRTKDLAEIISILEPNPPKMENLFVQGKNFQKCVKERASTIQKVPIVTIKTAEETEKETSEWSINPDAMIASLRIENKDITRRLNPKFGSKKEDDGPYNWDIKFNSTGSQLVERKIFFENKGNVKITFYWRPALYSSSLIPIRKIQTPPSFFFNKNKGIILPGQILKFPIWFKSCQSGIRTENWKLVTDPVLSSGEFLFRFWGFSSGEDERENNCKVKVQKIDEYLDIRIRDSAIKRILEEIVNDAVTFQPPEPPYRSLFLERDIFSAKNPSYFYHPSLINEFREMHRSIFNLNGPEWNLSLLDLRKLLLETEDPEIRQEALARFVELCRASLLPSLFNSSKSQKYEKVYDLLCSFANQFEVESQSIKNICIGSGEMEIESLTVGSGDQSRSNSVSRTSSGGLTPKPKIKTKKKLRRSLLSTNSKEEEKRNKKLSLLKPSDIIFYREIFYVRIYELLGETISKSCAVIDSYERLNEPEK